MGLPPQREPGGFPARLFSRSERDFVVDVLLGHLVGLAVGLAGFAGGGVVALGGFGLLGFVIVDERKKTPA